MRGHHSPESPTKTLFKICFIGAPRAGKSAFLQRLIDNKFLNNYEPTIGVAFGSQMVKTIDKKIKLQMWDTTSHAKFKNITTSYYRGAHAALVFLDSTTDEATNNQLLMQDCASVRELSPQTQIFVIRTKVDLVEDEKLSDDVAESMANAKNVVFLGSVSVKDNRKDADRIILEITRVMLACQSSQEHAQGARNEVPGNHNPLMNAYASPNSSEQLTNIIIRCLIACAATLDNQDDWSLDNKRLSKSQKRSVQKISAILSTYAVLESAIPKDRISFDENIVMLKEHIHSTINADQSQKDPNHRIKALLENKFVTQPRNTASFHSAIKNDLEAFYKPCKEKEDKIEKLVEALSRCLISCAKDCESPKNRAPTDFAKKSKEKIFAILHAHDIAINNDGADDLQATIHQSLHGEGGWKETFKQRASESENLSEYILALYNNTAITQNRGNKHSTLKKELEKLLPPLIPENRFSQ